MAHSKRTIAAIRFGYGLSPSARGAANAQDLLKSLRSKTASNVSDKKRLGQIKKLRDLLRDDSSKKRFEKLRKDLRGTLQQDFNRTLSIAASSDVGFSARLTQFWSDHFTVVASNLRNGLLAGAMIENAIRPNISGSFGDLLVAAVTHPAMVTYLDQISSMGENSVANKRGAKGLNENLAREILELHTMGVGARYTQKDVRQLAELLTGLHVNARGRHFRPNLSEPGAEVILGKTYGEQATLKNIEAALQDIAMHPDTAKHVSYKLVRHFVSDTPDPEQVAYMTEQYLRSGGDLTRTYRAMLEHPASWRDLGGKVKQPFDLIASTIRALDIDLRAALRGKRRPRNFRPFKMQATMGQPYLKASGPNGWPEAASFWITPSGMAARIDWARDMSSTFAQDRDPRGFLKDVLSDAASQKLRALAAGSEVKWEGVALILASPDFNRR